jgi:serine protease DegQ
VKSRISLIVACAMLSIGTVTPAFAQAIALEHDGKPSLAPLMQHVTPAVVNIAVEGSVEAPNNPLFDDPFFRRFFDVPDQQQPDRIPQQAAGSGVIVDAKNGYVLTNHHVIENADKITVTLSDRRRLDAKLIGSDEGTDVALLQVDADGLSALDFADSDDLEVGDYVIAIGNPFGLGQTVTSGIVSALGRSGLNAEGYEDFIQTDASINPGNSGGALVDLDGKLVGINSAIISPAGGNVGIGFAIPSDMARSVMDQLIHYGKVQRGLLGITIQDLTPDLATALDIKVDQGAIVTQVQPGSAAEKAGIAAGDVITALNGHEISGSTDLRNRIGLIRVGEEIEIEALRDGRSRTFHATINEAVAGTVSGGGGEQGGTALDKLQGAQLSNIPPGNPNYRRTEGVLVVDVNSDSPAWRAGLRPNDVITGVNRDAVTSLDDLKAKLENVGATFALNVVRGTARIFIVIQ